MSVLQEQVFKAYFDARRNKRGTKSQLKFEMDLERNLLVLTREIASGRYEVGRSICFIVTKPVKREVFAADFRDRVVHHLLYNWLAPMLERGFIADSYSCRKGKGTLYGISRTRKHIRQCTRNFTREAYILKVDLSGYFMSINRRKLLEVVLSEMDRYAHRRCGHGRLTWCEWLDYPLVKELLGKVILNNPIEGCLFRGKREDWEGLPANKSLFHAREGCGLPIGNLTSQLFSNVYLSAFDNRMKREEKLRYYGRYVDDIIVVHPDKVFLAGLMKRMEHILLTDFGLTLHPTKRLLQPAAWGIDFLGLRLRHDVLLPGKRLRRNLRYAIDAYLRASRHLPDYPTLRLHRARVNSYLGQLQHCASRRLRLLVWVTLYLAEEPYMLMDGTMRKVGAGYRARVRQSIGTSPTVDGIKSDSR